MRAFGYFKQKRLSRREQPGWTGARASAGPQGGPQTSPSRREAGRREQAKRDIFPVPKVTRPQAKLRLLPCGNYLFWKRFSLRFSKKAAMPSFLSSVPQVTP